MKIKAALIFAIVFTIQLFSQGNILDSVYTLDSVVVSSSRGAKELLNLPYSISYIDKNKIQQGEAGLSLDQLSGDVAGADINNRYNYSLGDKIILRGVGIRSSFGVRGIKIIYDDIPLTMPDGQSQTNVIDLSSAGRIEFLKGPASSLYGNSAGGVINIESELPSLQPLFIEPQFLAGSFGLQKYIVKTSGTLGSTSYLLSFNKFNHKGYRQHSSATSSSINAVVKNILSPSFLLKTVINYYNAPYLLNPSSLNKNDSENNPSSARSIIFQQGAGEKQSHIHGGITLNYFSRDFQLESTIYYLNRNVKNPIPGRIIELNRSAGGIRTAAEYHPENNFADISLKAGVDIEFQTDGRKEFENLGLDNTNVKPEDIFNTINYGEMLLNQDEKVLNASPFFASEIALMKNLKLSAGIRFDYYEFKVNDMLTENGNDSGLRIMQNLSPMAGIVYRPFELMKLYANYSTSFLTPTTSELSNRSDGKGGFNAELLPEKTISFEAGLQAFLSKLSISAAVYYMNFNDMLVPYQLSRSEEIFFRNAGKARNLGGEISAEYQLTDELNINLSYTYLDFKFSDYLAETGEETLIQLKGNEIPGIPEHHAGLSLLYSNSGFYTKLMINMNDQYYANDFNGPAPGSEGSVQDYINGSQLDMQIRSGYRFNLFQFEIELFAGVNNLLNRRYNSSIVPNAAGSRFFEPAPGINWLAGIKGSL